MNRATPITHYKSSQSYEGQIYINLLFVILSKPPKRYISKHVCFVVDQHTPLLSSRALDSQSNENQLRKIWEGPADVPRVEWKEQADDPGIEWVGLADNPVTGGRDKSI